MGYRRTARSYHLFGYILRAHAGPFLFSVSTLMFLFLLQFVMKFIDQLVGKGLTAWVIMELVTLNLSWMIVLTVPMSVLVAVLMAFGDLSSKNEITAMRASGVSIYRMMAPVLLASAVVAGGLIWFNNYVLPESNHRLKTLTIDIRRKRPTLTLVNGVFSQELPGYSILVRRVHQKTNDLEGVTLYDHTNPARSVVITAQRGKISLSSDYRKLVMDLREGEIHQLDLEEVSLYRRLRFDTHRIAMNVEGFDFERSSAGAFSRSDRELGAKAMRSIVDSLRTEHARLTEELRTTMLAESRERPSAGATAAPKPALPSPVQDPTLAALNKARFLSTTVATALFRIEGLERQMDQYLVEIHKKYSIPAACLVFVLVGVPLGIMSRRGGFGIAATLSLGFFVVYWACLIGGEKLADRDILSPFLGMWSANLLMGLAGIYLTVRMGRETMTINWAFFERFVPKRWRTEVEQQDLP